MATAIKNSVVRARIEQKLKEEVEGILKEVGLNTSDAINMLFNMIRLHRGLPFDVKIPNRDTLDTFAKTDAGKEVETFESLDDLKRAAKSWE